jgi:hypothetical protein
MFLGKWLSDKKRGIEREESSQQLDPIGSKHYWMHGIWKDSKISHPFNMHNWTMDWWQNRFSLRKYFHHHHFTIIITQIEMSQLLSICHIYTHMCSKFSLCKLIIEIFAFIYEWMIGKFSNRQFKSFLSHNIFLRDNKIQLN